MGDLRPKWGFKTRIFALFHSQKCLFQNLLCHGANAIILQKAIFFIVPVFSLQPLPTTSANHLFSSFSFLFRSQSDLVLGIVFGLFSALLSVGLLLTALFEAQKKNLRQACQKALFKVLSIFSFRIIFFALFRVFLGLNGYPYFIVKPCAVIIYFRRLMRKALFHLLNLVIDKTKQCGTII